MQFGTRKMKRFVSGPKSGGITGGGTPGKKCTLLEMQKMLWDLRKSFKNCIRAIAN